MLSTKDYPINAQWYECDVFVSGPFLEQLLSMNL